MPESLPNPQNPVLQSYHYCTYLDLAILAITVQAEDDVAEDLGDVDGHIERADDTRVAIWQAILYVIQRRVYQHAAVIPGR